MKNASLRLLCALFASTATLSAHALPTSVSTGNVVVQYDSDTFSFVTADDGHNPFGTIQYTHIPVGSLTLQPVANGMEILFNNQMSIDDPTHGLFDDYQPSTGRFSAGFAFQAQPGYTITGYNITLAGSGTVSTFGPANARAFIDGFDPLEFGGGLIFFNEIFTVAGALAPLLSGGIDAQSEPSAYEVIVGYQDVLVGYEEYYEDPNCETPGCPTYRIDIYETQPIIELQENGGYASIRLDSVRITANVMAIPLPATGLLFASGLAYLGVAQHRRGGTRHA